MPSTLIELYTMTKGLEYVVIGAYLLLFISFWRFLTYRDKK
ncbi:MAG: sulfate respiration complex protein HmcD [Desulfomonilaceae bacterium]